MTQAGDAFNFCNLSDYHTKQNYDARLRRASGVPMFANGAATAAFASLISSAAQSRGQVVDRVDVGGGETRTIYRDSGGEYYVSKIDGQKVYLGKSLGYVAENWSYDELARAYQSREDMLQGRSFPRWAMDAMNEGGTCACRLSNAFNRAGYDTINDAFRNTSIPTVGDGSGNRYVLGAAALADHLNVDQSINLVDSISAIQGKQGIIYFENYHIDLFDGQGMVGNGQVTPNYSGNKIYFKELD